MNIILCGASGKMGRAVAEGASSQGVRIVCGVDENPFPMPFPVYRSFGEVFKSADAVIDFSSPRGIMERLNFCRKKNLGIVIATTGFSPEDEALIERASKEIPIFQSANFSIGICLLNRLVRQAAQILQDFDAELVERHHSEKKDSPSGTALQLAKSVREVRGGEIILGRSGKRNSNEIGVHSVRGGTLVGEHEVSFLGEDEVLTLSHSARSRTIFALGALRAAKWLCRQPAGKYDMDDMLSQK